MNIYSKKLAEKQIKLVQYIYIYIGTSCYTIHIMLPSPPHTIQYTV